MKQSNRKFKKRTVKQIKSESISTISNSIFLVWEIPELDLPEMKWDSFEVEWDFSFSQWDFSELEMPKLEKWEISETEWKPFTPE